MSSDEDDYMSAEILAACVQKDSRPGLQHSRAAQRTHELAKKKEVTDAINKAKNPNQRVLEAERREEGLEKTLDSQNKGFAMLQKMGYKPGTAIGKSGDGRVEPVPLVIKSGRQGLGREAALKELQAQKFAIRARRVQRREDDAASFRLRLSQQAVERQAVSDLRRSQRVCEELDQQQGVATPLQPWFWPLREKEAAAEGEKAKDEDEIDEEKEAPTLHRPDEEEKEEEQEEEEEEEEEFAVGEQLELLTGYLRRTFLYCVWCGTKFDDEGDLRDSCPGPTRDDH